MYSHEHTQRSKKRVCTMAVDFSKSKTRENLMRICRRESGKESLYNSRERRVEIICIPLARFFYSLQIRSWAHAEVFYELLRGQTEQTIEICMYPVNLAENVRSSEKCGA